MFQDSRLHALCRVVRALHMGSSWDSVGRQNVAWRARCYSSSATMLPLAPAAAYLAERLSARCCRNALRRMPCKCPISQPLARKQLSLTLRDSRVPDERR